MRGEVILRLRDRSTFVDVPRYGVRLSSLSLLLVLAVLFAPGETYAGGRAVGGRDGAPLAGRILAPTIDQGLAHQLRVLPRTPDRTHPDERWSQVIWAVVLPGVLGLSLTACSAPARAGRSARRPISITPRLGRGPPVLQTA